LGGKSGIKWAENQPFFMGLGAAGGVRRGAGIGLQNLGKIGDLGGLEAVWQGWRLKIFKSHLNHCFCLIRTLSKTPLIAGIFPPLSPVYCELNCE